MAELLQREPQYTPLWQQIGRSVHFHRWAGLSGATAIIFSAYLENGLLSNFDKNAVALANQINYIHSLVLLAIPLTRRPNLSGLLFLIGMCIYCLGCYFCALFGVNGYVTFSLIGSVILIVAWLSLLF